MRRVALGVFLLGCAKPAPSSAPAVPPIASPAPSQPAPLDPRVRTDLAALGYFPEEPAPAREKCAGAADGRELVGRTLPEWSLGGWVGGAPGSLAALRGRVVVVRFWTAGCPYCERTLPALQRLADELAGKPVTFVGAFHAKPVAAFADLAEPGKLAARWGVKFALGLDPDWRTLRAWWLETGHRHASSVTFVIGPDGRVVHVHPGPVFYPSAAPADDRPNADYLALRAAVLGALPR